MVRQNSAIDHRQRRRFRNQLRAFAGRGFADHDSHGLRDQILRAPEGEQTAFVLRVAAREDEVRLAIRHGETGSQGKQTGVAFCVAARECEVHLAIGHGEIGSQGG